MTWSTFLFLKNKKQNFLKKNTGYFLKKQRRTLSNSSPPAGGSGTGGASPPAPPIRWQAKKTGGNYQGGDIFPLLIRAIIQ
jgi:hypothetical protein